MQTNEKEIRSICSYYLRVKNVDKVAVKFIRSETFIRKILKEAGVLEPRVVVTEEQKAEMKRLRSEGYQAKAIANTLGLSQKSIFRYWNE